MPNLNQKAKSKVQRRLFALAYLYKLGRIEKEFVSEQVIKLSDLPETTLRRFASTNQKKRKKDGSISKRNDIPERISKK
jgi:hypothetical protein